ncbi:hypothetical protein PYW07_016889 [Mythimna separata]|uniref:Alpha 1,4-glycosyltransferase domain-containing protein n=1 Tax=Mythimna separata TaxID=271217 RepID=A0AAD7YUE3_MYTSE|nr:hypothetical protein PYW07_016889 [Mythimna separata]
MFAFSNNKAGRTLIHEAMSLLLPELEEHGRHDLWSYSRPSVITDLLQYWCATGDVKRMTPLKCRDLVVHGPELFYPISFHNRSQYFRTVDGNSWKHKLTHTYFIWHRFTKYNIITPGSIYGRIAHEYCPITYQRYSGMSGVWYSEYDDMHDSILD